MIRSIAIVAALVATAGAAQSHDWYTGKRDPIYNSTTCCGGIECGPLPKGSLEVTPKGVRIRLTLEQAMQINRTRVEAFDEFIEFDRIQESEDGQSHICLMRMNMDDRKGYYCVFLPRNS